MASGVLFDAPGPATKARHRLYTILSAVALVAIVGFVIWRLQATGQFAYAKWEVFVTPRYVESILVDGLLTTLKMAFSAVLLAVVFGVIFGIGKLSEHAWIRWPCWLIVEIFRAIPVVMLMIFMFFGALTGVGEVDTKAYWSVVIALMLYNGAVLAEVFRAGILAVPRGQAEAAYAVGMRKTQVMTHVLLPQGVKIMIPAIISQCVVALKDTSLGYVIVAPGLTYMARQIFQPYQNHVATILVISAIYIIVNLLLSLLATWAQRKFVGEKKPLQVAMVGKPDEGGTGLAPGNEV